MTQDQESTKKTGLSALAESLGLTMIEEMVKQFMNKGQGRAPADDAGGGPVSVKESDKANTPSMIQDDSKKAPKVASKGVDGTEIKAGSEVLQGKPAQPGPAAEVVEGNPVQPTYKSLLEGLEKLEASAVDAEAMAVAKEALVAAFNPAPEEEGMKQEEVTELVLKGLDPIITAVEELTEKVSALEASMEKAKKPPFAKKEPVEPDADEQEPDADDEMTAQKQMLKSLNALNARLDALELSKSRPAGSSRIPAGEPLKKSTDSLWAGSPFDVNL